MTLDAFIMLAGALVATLPFLGFPSSWDTVILFILGVLIVVAGIVMRRRSGSQSREVREAFVESDPHAGHEA